MGRDKQALKTKLKQSEAVVSADAVAPQQGFSISATKDSDAQAGSFNPWDDGNYTGYTFDTNFDSDPGGGGDITYAEATGRFTFVAGGVFMVDLSPYILISANDTVDQDTQISSGSVWHPATDVLLNAVADRISMPVALVLAPTASQFLEHFMDSVSTTLTALDGSSVTLTEVPDITGSPDVHLICVTCDDSTVQNTSSILPFDEDSYAVTGNFTTHVQNGVVFTPGDGRLTINRTATYLVQVIFVHETTAVGDFDWEIRKNGVAVWQPATQQNHQAVQPSVRTVTLQLELVSGDYLEVEFDYISNAGGTKPGTSISIMEMAA